MSTAESPTVGFATAAVAAMSYIGATATSWGYFGPNGQKYTNNSGAAYGNTWGNGAVIGYALDVDVGKLWWALNGIWQASGDPAAGTNAAFSGLSGTFRAAIGPNLNATHTHTVTANFGATAFTYTPPSGFNSGLYS